ATFLISNLEANTSYLVRAASRNLAPAKLREAARTKYEVLASRLLMRKVAPKKIQGNHIGLDFHHYL
uniref:Fibronectin type-III domain-containing protein n=1 Tax=Glossina morsitans morsitans TaxID=37546 RepID=A0A1B0F9V6_GLOMM